MKMDHKVVFPRAIEGAREKHNKETLKREREAKREEEEQRRAAK
jgi:hypothetical protein